MQKLKITSQRLKLKVKGFNFLFGVFALLSCLSAFTGCATTALVMPPKPEGVPGFYHQLTRGQTLWSVSKIYKADLDEIVKINKISDVTNIEAGQYIFIPEIKKTQALPERFSTEDFMWPVMGKIILNFGQISNNMVNKGINIQPGASLSVVASRSGKVTFYSPDFSGFGKTIIINHGDGFLTVYARNSEIFVKPGDDVRKGGLIAKVGSSGGRDKDAYLHFEIRKGHVSQNPYFYLSR